MQKTFAIPAFAGVALVLLLSGCGEAVPVPESTPAMPETVTTEADIRLSEAEATAFEFANRERTTRRLPALALHANLVRLARKHAEYMATVERLTHRDRRNRLVDARYDEAGIAWRYCAENVGRNRGLGNPAAAAVQSWMRSPPHRKTLLDKRYTHTGIGSSIDQHSGYAYFVQLFLQPPASGTKLRP